MSENGPSAGVPALPVVLLAGWWMARVAGYVLVAPLVEELAFRGYLMRRLLSADFEQVPPCRFSWFALAGSAALFGALHGGAWLAGCGAGVLCGLALYRRGRVADAFWAHATANALIAIYVVATESWYLWS